jgi:hypothetical protein
MSTGTLLHGETENIDILQNCFFSIFATYYMRDEAVSGY